jgi:peptidoglycan/LPS O-acetylase OafA/YrhL
LEDRVRSAIDAEFFPALTGLRGIAAFCVMVFHAPALGLGTFFVAATAFFLKSYVWVDFFFLLSGFVIAHAPASASARRSSGPARPVTCGRASRGFTRSIS